MRKKARIDANQPEIVAALRKAGATVQSLATIGNGCPDLLVGYRGHNYLMEIKDGAKPLSERALTEDECKWIRGWRGDVYVVSDVMTALDIIGCGASEGI